MPAIRLTGIWIRALAIVFFLLLNACTVGLQTGSLGSSKKGSSTGLPFGSTGDDSTSDDGSSGDDDGGIGDADPPGDDPGPIGGDSVGNDSDDPGEHGGDDGGTSDGIGTTNPCLSELYLLDKIYCAISAGLTDSQLDVSISTVIETLSATYQVSPQGVGEGFFFYSKLSGQTWSNPDTINAEDFDAYNKIPISGSEADQLYTSSEYSYSPVPDVVNGPEDSWAGEYRTFFAWVDNEDIYFSEIMNLSFAIPLDYFFSTNFDPAFSAPWRHLDMDVDGSYMAISRRPFSGFDDNHEVAVYRRSGFDWTLDQIISPKSQDPLHNWGHRVAISDPGGKPILAISDYQAPSAGGGNPGAGRVYLYERDPSQGWNRRHTLSPGDHGHHQPSAAYLGDTITFDGKILIAGAPGYNEPFYASGALFTWYRDGSNIWHAGQILQATSICDQGQNECIMGLGNSDLDAGSGTLVAGAKNYQDQSLWSAGGALVFVRSGFNYSYDTMLTPAFPDPGIQFGSQVAVHGDWIAVGSRPNNGQEEKVFLFTKNQFGFIGPEQASISGSGPTGIFGRSIDIGKDHLLIGDAASGSDSKTIVYRRNVNNWNYLTDFEAQSPSHEMGCNVAITVDPFNGKETLYSQACMEGFGTVYMYVKE